MNLQSYFESKGIGIHDIPEHKFCMVFSDDDPRVIWISKGNFEYLKCLPVDDVKHVSLVSKIYTDRNRLSTAYQFLRRGIND